MHTLVIPGTLPGLNDYIRTERGHKHQAAKLKKRIENNIGWLIKQQLQGIKIAEPVIISYLWLEPNRMRDKDNIAWAKKFIQDALVRAQILEGDSWKHIISFKDEFAVDKTNPRIEIRIHIAKEVQPCDFCGQVVI